MIRKSLIHLGESPIDKGGANDEGWWTAIVQDLVAAGLNDDEGATLLRQREAWIAEAREMLAEGYPYDEIIFHLSTIRASWAEVGRALMAVGVPPSEMLRAVLPLTEGKTHWSVVQVALLEGPEEADFGEVCGMLAFFFISREEALETLDLNGIQREIVARRLGIFL